MPFGCKIRYLPHAEREVEQREKLDPSLRDGIFVGYRSHSGGKWTGQYEVLDCDAYAKVAGGSGRKAYVHAVSEVYIPGSAGDDQEKHPTFPVADGRLSEAAPTADDEESSEELVNNVESLQTEMEETLLSSTRASHDHDPNGPQNAGGVGDRANETAEEESAAGVSDQDSWRIEGDYLVRVHLVPRTTLFSPVDVPNDPPPIDVRHIEVLRTTKPPFAGTQWPDMNVIEDAWSGNPSDARSLHNPGDGSTLTWTGETCFERVRPPPPKGKTWCMGELVNVRRGTQRADDVHPLQWWLLSEAARKEAAVSWKIKHGEILRATNRRSIPREPLENMPPSTTTTTTPAAMMVPVSKFIVSNDSIDHATTSSNDLKRLEPSTIAAVSGITTTNNNTAKPIVGDWWEDNVDMTLGMGSVSVQNTEFDNTVDQPPKLVDESDDEEWRQHGETHSECSSADTEDNFQFLLEHYNADKTSDGESSEDDTSRCAACALPRWTSGNNPSVHHCRNFCMHGSVSPDTYAHQDAPVFKEPASVTPLSHALCSPLLPPEIAEILKSAEPPLSRKKLKRQAKLAQQSGETFL